MSDVVFSHSRGTRTRSRRGQSVVEFALVLPILLILLLGIADFGRVFAAGITIEASARNGAEAAAQEYLQLRREALALSSDDFDRIHTVALESVCEEADVLPNQAPAGATCTMPAAAVCIHDDAAELANYGSHCGAEAAAAPPECTLLHDAWPATQPQTGMLPWVEVRICYRFTTLINLVDVNMPFGAGMSLGEVWLQRTRIFAVADY